jgi:hypothetical protein
MVRQGSQQSTVALPSGGDSKWRGQLAYPSPPLEGLKAGMAALSVSTESTTSDAQFDKATDAAVNGRLGLVAVGTERYGITILPQS